MTLLKDIFTAAIFLPLALCYGYSSKKIRPTLAERLGGGEWQEIPKDNAKWLWIHGASVGELAAVEPLLEKIHQTSPDKKILITATSATGCERAKKLPHVTAALVLPFDLRLLYQRALKDMHVEQLIVLETELWPSLFSFARDKGIETIILNARISDETFPRYLKYKWYFSRVLKSVSMIFAQSEIDAQRYFKLGVEPGALVVSGSTKFDIAFAAREDLQKKYRAEYGLDSHRPTLTIGCLRKEEESLLLGAMEGVFRVIPELQVIIVPRHPERFVPVANELQRLGIDFHLRSQGANMVGKSVVLIDAMGELSAAYALAEVAIVCGAFSNAGGHNPLEAAAVGAAVIIGPQYYNVRTAVEVLQKFSVLQIADGPTQLIEQVVALFADKQKLSTMPTVAMKAASELTGTCERVASYLKANHHVAYAAGIINFGFSQAPSPSSISFAGGKKSNKYTGRTLQIWFIQSRILKCVQYSALQPLASLYGVGVRLRNKLFDDAILPTYRSTLPVICVGNISLGGNGKTPFCLFLLELLQNQGRHPVLLTRGYGGKSIGPLLLEASHTATEVGDEALLYRQQFANLPIVIARDRVAGAKVVEQQKLGDCIVLDDGFQHRYLQRDVNFVLFDSSTNGLAEGEISDHLLPRGRLREPAFEALQRADAVIFVCKQLNNSEISVPYALELPSWKFNLLPTTFVDVFNGAVVAPEGLPNSVTAVAAIARPESFVQSLTQIGVVPAQKQFFRDHHSYTSCQWEEITAAAQLPIVTTSKDAVKLKSYLTAPGQLLALQLHGALPTDKQQSFVTFLNSKMP